MQLALCGAPGSGKTTLFGALAGRRLGAERGHGEAGTAILSVPDERIDALSKLYNPKKTIHAQITYIDPAPPKQATDDPATRLPQELRQAEGLVEVVRNFDEGMGQPTPVQDHQAFCDELILSDLVTVENRLERIAGEKRRGREIDQEEISLLEKARDLLGEEQNLREHPELAGHIKLRGFGLFTAKPLIVVANNAEDDPQPPDMGEGVEPVVVRAAIEAELAELDDEERGEFMADLGLTQSALDRLIAASYAALDLISFFTVGSDEVRAWTIRRGTPSVEAAGVIHSDLQRGFIRGEVMDHAQLLEHGSEAALKKAGLVKVVGKDFVISDGEIFHVLFNV